MLSLLIFLPVSIALLLLLVPANMKNVFRASALTVAIGQLVLSITLATQFDTGTEGFQLFEKAAWIQISLGQWGNFTAWYWVGLDGMSLPLVVMTSMVMVVATLSAWKTEQHAKGFFVLMLVMNTAIVGAFAAMDALLFFVFFEFMLIPMYFLIGIWGGPKREYASVKFFLYTLLGSIFILIVFIGLYTSIRNEDVPNGAHSFAITQLTNASNIIDNSILAPNSDAGLMGWNWRTWAFVMIFLGFAIKLPIVPFHTWLPDAHVEAPTSISIILAALLLKVGGYGLIRFVFSIFPDVAASFSVVLGILALVSIIYGAFNAMASKDLKRLIAYSSVSHMGFVLLGVTSATVEGIGGAVFQMVSHGITSAMLFAITGVLHDRTHDRTISSYSGLYSLMPVYTAFVLIGFFGAMGIPGFSSFIGEVMVFLGSFASSNINGLLPRWIAVIAVLGIILTAGYFVWTLQRMFFGKQFVNGHQALRDVSLRELLILMPLAILTLGLGIYPQPLLDFINPFAIKLASLMASIPQ